MAVRSGRIFGPVDLGTAFSTLFTVPAGRTLIVRTVHLVQHNAANGNTRLTLNGTGGADEIWREIGQLANSTRRLDTWWALSPGDVVHGITNIAGACAVSFYGALLLGEEADLPL